MEYLKACIFLGNLIIKGKSNLLISVGNILKLVIEASNELKRKKINNAVIDLRYVKPLDGKVLKIAFKKFDLSALIFLISGIFVDYLLTSEKQ